MDDGVNGGDVIDEYPDINFGEQFNMENMFDSDPSTIFAGEKNNLDLDEPMRQYRRIPFLFPDPVDFRSLVILKSSRYPVWDNTDYHGIPFKGEKYGKTNYNKICLRQVSILMLKVCAVIGWCALIHNLID